jgi:hypothetical protein
MPTIQRRIVPVALSLLLLVSCTTSDAPSAPNRAASHGLLSGIVGNSTTSLVAPIGRVTALPADVSWSFVAGPDGAESTNAALGITITIPRGALASTQLITVTAPAGRAIAYEFSPHLTFAVPVQLTQALRGTAAGLTGRLLTAGHFTTGGLSLSSAGLTAVDEAVPVVVDLLSGAAHFNVGHFSGWIIATGRDDGSDSSDTTGLTGL